jgi:hypothetical protein
MRSPGASPGLTSRSETSEAKELKTMTMLLNRPVQSQARPVAGTCRWVFPLNQRDTGVLAINDAEYFVTAYRDRDGHAQGYRLEKPDGTAYDIDTTSRDWQCDCPDATYRQRECKHAKALRVALTSRKA